MKIKKIYKKLAVPIFISLLFTGCGSSSNSETLEEEQAPPKELTNPFTGIVIDSAVSGLNYKCSSDINGVTNSKGEFTCENNDTVSFSLGSTFLGELEVTKTITPLMIFKGDEKASLNFAQLIQTLDKDANLSNGIDIDTNIISMLGDINFTSNSFDEDIQILLGNDKVLVSETDANTHLNETFTSLDINADGTIRVEEEPEVIEPEIEVPVIEEPIVEPTPKPEEPVIEEPIVETPQPETPVVVEPTPTPDPVYIPPTPEPTPQPVNHAPIISSNASIGVAENNTTAMTITATDEDSDTLAYSISGTDADSFNINSSTGVITFKIAPDYETKDSYTFTATVSDETLSDSQTIVIHITDVDETVEPIDPVTGVFVDAVVKGLSYISSSGISGVTNTLGEFTCERGDTISFYLGSTLLGEIAFSETITPTMIFPDNAAAALNFAQLIQTLDSDNDLSNGITIDTTILETLGIIDFTSPTFDEDIQVLLGDVVLISEADAQAHLDETFITLGINADGTELVVTPSTPTYTPPSPPSDSTPPVFTSDANISVTENNTTVITLVATDTSTITYSLGGTDSPSFSVNSSSGAVTFNTAPDYETKTSYTLTTTATDTSSNASTQDLNITIVNVVETLSISNFTTSIDENTSTGSTIGTVTISSSGESSITSFTISDTVNFEVNTSGSVKTKTTFDYETTTKYDLTLYATNTQGNSTSVDFNITISNIAEKPILANFTASVDENATVGTAVGNITISDAGDSNITAFTLSDTTNFEVNASGYIKTKTTLDYENNTTYNLEVNATNSAGVSANKTVTINITNIGDFYITSAVYDNNATTSVADDKLYVYFNQAIKASTITADSNYLINTTGAIDANSISSYDDTIFHRHLTKIASGSTAFTANDTNITIATATMTDDSADAKFIEGDNNETVIEAFRQILQTGQTTTYAEFDDGNTTRGKARSYTDNGDTVTDNATGLIWQKEDDNNTYAWSSDGTATEASDYCTTLNLGGSSAWRLPTIEELVSITDKGRYNPAIDHIFTNTNSSPYWSSTTYAGDTSYAWLVYFSSGSGNAVGKTSTLFVRCVR